MNYKFGIGVMSKNIVDACIKFTELYHQNLILIPSRRQVDFSGGYVNDWTTETLSLYVKNQSNNIIIKRDHGGPKQGQIDDDGLISLTNDCLYLDAIHIDPWKNSESFIDGCLQTLNLIKFCFSKNNKIIYEIGTEEAIFKYEAEQLNYLIKYLKNNLKSEIFSQIKYAVIQSGTALKETNNIGSYNNQRLIDMISVTKQFNLKSKEHNGDYLPIILINEKFSYGLDSLNIAPEFGLIETKTYINELNQYMLDEFFTICYESKKWVKWVNSKFDPFSNKLNLIHICGHYVFNNPRFIKNIKNNVRIDIDDIIKYNLIQKLKELYGISK